MKRRDGRWTVAVVSFGGQGKTGQCHQLQAGPYLMAEVRTVRQVAEALATGGYTLADLEEAADESPPGCSAEAWSAPFPVWIREVRGLMYCY
jgi:hypothetical protein